MTRIRTLLNLENTNQNNLVERQLEILQAGNDLRFPGVGRILGHGLENNNEHTIQIGEALLNTTIRNVADVETNVGNQLQNYQNLITNASEEIILNNLERVFVPTINTDLIQNIGINHVAHFDEINRQVILLMDQGRQNLILRLGGENALYDHWLVHHRFIHRDMTFGPLNFDRAGVNWVTTGENLQNLFNNLVDTFFFFGENVVYDLLFLMDRYPQLMGLLMLINFTPFLILFFPFRYFDFMTFNEFLQILQSSLEEASRYWRRLRNRLEVDSILTRSRETLRLLRVNFSNLLESNYQGAQSISRNIINQVRQNWGFSFNSLRGFFLNNSRPILGFGLGLGIGMSLLFNRNNNNFRNSNYLSFLNDRILNLERDRMIISPIPRDSLQSNENIKEILKNMFKLFKKLINEINPWNNK